MGLTIKTMIVETRDSRAARLARERNAFYENFFKMPNALQSPDRNVTFYSFFSSLWMVFLSWCTINIATASHSGHERLHDQKVAHDTPVSAHHNHDQ